MHLEQFNKAIPLLDRGLEISNQIFGPTSPLSISLLESLADTNLQSNKLSVAEKRVSELVSAYATQQQFESQIRSMENLILVLQRNMKFAEATEVAKKTIPILQTSELDQTLRESIHARVLVRQAFNLSCQNNPEASALYHEAVDRAPAASQVDQAFIHYHLAQFELIPNNQSNAVTTLENAKSLLESLPSKNRRAQTLTALINNSLMDLCLQKKDWDQAEVHGKLSLDIINHFDHEKNSPLLEYSLHLMSWVMLGMGKYFFAEGLFRKLDGLIDQHMQGKRPVYRIQIQTIEEFIKLMELLNRVGDARQLDDKLKMLQSSDVHPTIHFHALFESTDFRKLDTPIKE